MNLPMQFTNFYLQVQFTKLHHLRLNLPTFTCIYRCNLPHLQSNLPIYSLIYQFSRIYSLIYQKFPPDFYRPIYQLPQLSLFGSPRLRDDFFFKYFLSCWDRLAVGPPPAPGNDPPRNATQPATIYNIL